MERIDSSTLSFTCDVTYIRLLLLGKVSRELDVFIVWAKMASLGAIESVLALIRVATRPGGDETVRILFKQLKSILHAAKEEGCARAYAAGAIDTIAAAMAEHSAEAPLQREGAFALASLALHSEEACSALAAGPAQRGRRSAVQLLLSAAADSGYDGKRRLTAMRGVERVAAVVPAAIMLDTGAAESILSLLREAGRSPGDTPSPQQRELQAVGLSTLLTILAGKRGASSGARSGASSGAGFSPGGAFALRMLRSSVEDCVAAALAAHWNFEDVAAPAAGLLLRLLRADSEPSTELNVNALRRATSAGSIQRVLLVVAADSTPPADGSCRRELTSRLLEPDAIRVLAQVRLRSLLKAGSSLHTRCCAVRFNELPHPRLSSHATRTIQFGFCLSPHRQQQIIEFVRSLVARACRFLLAPPGFKFPLVLINQAVQKRLGAPPCHSCPCARSHFRTRLASLVCSNRPSHSSLSVFSTYIFDHFFVPRHRPSRRTRADSPTP